MPKTLWTKIRKEANRAVRKFKFKVPFIFRPSIPLSDLVILDDFFPHPLSPFRIAEYNAYLGRFINAKVCTTGESLRCLDENISLAEVIGEYNQNYPEFSRKVLPFDEYELLNAKLVYSVFLNNIFRFIKFIERNRIPFAFTLYPGGGFQLNTDDGDRKLRRVFQSPFFRKVIVTQSISYDYIVSKGFCSPDHVEFVFGVVTPQNLIDEQPPRKHYFRGDKNTFDVCFVAHKYMKNGVDKGFDIFIQMTKLLPPRLRDIRFHVVGGYDESDGCEDLIDGSVCFHGSRLHGWFPDFYASMDIIISPNVPFVLLPGAFDGFPTACCTEASLCGVAVFCTDLLKLNRQFIDREEIEIVDHDPHQIAERVLYYYHHTDELYRLAEKGRAKTRSIYGYDNQVAPRISLLEKLINN